MQVVYIKCLAFDDRLVPNGLGQGHVTRFFKFCPNYIFGIGEARHFKFRVLIDTHEYEFMHNILPPKGMCDVSCDLFQYWEISDNISLTVQDRELQWNTEH